MSVALVAEVADKEAEPVPFPVEHPRRRIAVEDVPDRDLDLRLIGEG
jgi:hypothetical protein